MMKTSLKPVVNSHSSTVATKGIRKVAGFSLIEIAIGMAILALAAVGLIASISKQAEQNKLKETRQILEVARDAMLAFVGTNGRLPCPALAASNGQESIANVVGGTVNCSAESGFLPAVTLGMSDVDANGLLNDAFEDGAGQANGTFLRALRYGTSSLAPPLTYALQSPGLGNPSAASRRVDVQNAINAGQGVFVCRGVAGTGAGANRCGNAANTLATNAIAVIWSRGLNGNDLAAYSADENQNANQTLARTYINRNFAPAGATGGAFDDQLIWISYPILADRLVRGGFVQ